MPLEPHKILPVVEDLAAVRIGENIATLAALAATNSELRQLCLPYLFSRVRWPHPTKYDEEIGLHFFPESLWPLFKRFDLIWPDDWPDASPPRWGDRYYVGGDYHPRHTDKLATALPRMPSLISFSICCPFFPPNSLFNALLTCTSVRELRMTDTPLYISMIPKSPPEFVIERLYLIPVAEAPRVGQSPYEARYSSPALYHSREYRKKYKNDILARYAASAFLFDVGKPTSLTHVQVSGDLCTLDEFAQHDWPRLASLVMTGHPPRQTGTELVDVINKMPELKELRLLFAKSVARGDAMFKVLPAAPEYTSAKGNHGSLLEQIESLAVSDACNLDRVGYFIKGVKRLAILAISDIADPTAAFTKRTLQRVLREVSAAGTPAPKTIPPKPQPKGKDAQRDPEPEPVSTRPEVINKNQTLNHLRVMLGERIEPEFCKFLADRFPKLEYLEVERCGYHDGRDVAPWSAYIENLKPIRRTLKHLRLGMQFEEQEPLHKCTPDPRHVCAINDDVDHHHHNHNHNHHHHSHPRSHPHSNSHSTSTPTTNAKAAVAAKPSWHLEREKCASYFAAKLGQLIRVGFEYRKRPGPHRLDDRWVDWEIVRRRFTPQMTEQWQVRREAKLARLAEERKQRAEEMRKKIEQEEKELLERFQKEQEERRAREERERKEREAREKRDREEQERIQKEEQERREREERERRERRARERKEREEREGPEEDEEDEETVVEDGDEKQANGNVGKMSRSSTKRRSTAVTPSSSTGPTTATTPSASTTSLTMPLTQPSQSSSSNISNSYTSTAGITSTSYATYTPYGTLTSSSSPTNTPTYSPPSRNPHPHYDYFFMNYRPMHTYYEEEVEGSDWDSDDEDPEGILGIHELRASWYPFPEVWNSRTLYEEEEVADIGPDV